MGETVSLHIYRRLDNRLLGDWEDKSPLALELHNRRKEALERVLDDPSIDVSEWGCTRDTKSHELVQLTIEFLSSPVIASFAGAAIAWIGKRIAGAVSSATEDGIKVLVQRLFKEQKQNRVLDYTILGPDGTTLLTVRPSVDGADARPLSIEVTHGADTFTIRIEEIPD